MLKLEELKPELLLVSEIRIFAVENAVCVMEPSILGMENCY
jgi:hypothetical protein